MSDENEQETIRQILRALLEQMGIVAEIETRLADEIPIFDLKTSDSNLLIGQHGGNLAALQYLVRHLAYKRLGKPVHFIVDVEGYKRGREEYLRALARQVAERVRGTKESLLLKPMSAYERRVIHAEISQFQDVASESTGEEPERRIVIKPKA